MAAFTCASAQTCAFSTTKTFRPSGLTAQQAPCRLQCRGERKHLICRASQQDSWTSKLASKVAAAGAATLLSLSPLSGALAGEFEIASEPTPTTNYVIDDAAVLNKVTKGDLNKKLRQLEVETGYRLEVVTVRKLEFETDGFAFADKLIEGWYKTVENGSNKGVLLIVTTAKDGAVTGGPKFLKAVGDQLIDSVVGENIPILTEEEFFNETATSSAERIAAALQGRPDPGAPSRKDNTRRRTYKTKEETDKTKNITATLVLTLLGISVVVPMLQYWGYTSKD